jgi:drug/metabolite transporter (DMT)-like permease
VSRKALGTLLVSISASAFGTYSYFAILAGNAGVGTVSLLFFRFAIAACILAGIAVLTKSAAPNPRQFLALIGLGALYVGQSFTFLQCLRASNPITASLLLYLYPALVTIGSVLFLHEKLTPVKLFAVLCALLGSAFIVGPIGDIGLAAVAYGLATAVFYSAYLLTGKRVMATVAPASATLVILTTAALTYGAASLFTGIQTPSSSIGWVGIVCLALVATVIAIGCLLWGLDKVSPVEASSLSALEPLVSALIAILILGQEPRLWHVIGGVLVIVAVLVLARQAGVASDGNIG